MRGNRFAFRLLAGVSAGFALGAAVTVGVHAQAKPPAYTIAEIEVTDPSTFQQYGQATGKSVPEAGGRIIVRGGKSFVVNGPPPKQIVVIQWESLEKAQAFFESEGYRKLVPIRDKSSHFRAFVIEGVQ
jgi:uncharacterized protein (DUF1330 family)